MNLLSSNVCLVRILAMVATCDPMSTRVFAQATPPATDDARRAKESAAVVLSVFEVSDSKDVGYRASVTASGTRTGEELKNVPQTITVLTNEFLRDTGATDSLNAMEYVIGGGNKPLNSLDVNRFVFRGAINVAPSRNFHAWFVPSDSFSTERIDIVRGPNSILFGEGDPGGMMNINTKRAKFRNEVSVASRVGSWNQFRNTVDANYLVRPNLGVRVNLVYDTRDNWQKWVGHERQGIHFTTTLRSKSGDTQLRYEGEYGKYIRRVPQVFPKDQFSLWDGRTPYAFNAATGPAGTQRLSSATGTNQWVWDNTVGALRDWRGFGQTGGLTDLQTSNVKDPAIVPRGSNFFGPSYQHNFEYDSHTLMLDHRVGRDLTLQIEGTVSTDTIHRENTSENMLRRDPNATMPGGVPNPNFGAYYLDYLFTIARNHHFSPSTRLSTVYDWKPAAWMRQRFFGNFSVRYEQFGTNTTREAIVNNAAVPAFNGNGARIFHRVYLKNGDDATNVADNTLIRDAATGLQSAFRTTQAKNLTDLYLGNAQLNASGQYFDGKFRTLFGLRRDNYRNYQTPSVRDAVTGEFNRAGQVSALASKAYNTSHTAGVMWQPTSRYTLYVAQATSFRTRPADAVRIDGTSVGPQVGKGGELGLRLDFLEGKFYVQGCVFDLDQKLRVLSVPSTISTINAIWASTAANAIRPGYVNNSLVSGTNDTDALNSKGYELETWLNLVPGWTLQGGYSFSNPKSTDVAPISTAYIKANLAGWRQVAATDATVAASLNPNIASLQNFLDTQIPGTRTVGANQHSFSLFTKYKLPESVLRGLDFGVGANYRSGSVVENRVTAGRVNPVYGASTLVVNALVGYQRRLTQKVRWSAALNVGNLLNRDYYVETNVDRSLYGDPRSWVLTNTFSF
ncbi:MAG: hypothetical protein EXS37_04290 [Opitutus sp.]|nr:hypothetical protein [Opitutus sp.]